MRLKSLLSNRLSEKEKVFLKENEMKFLCRRDLKKPMRFNLTIVKKTYLEYVESEKILTSSVIS